MHLPVHLYQQISLEAGEEVLGPPLAPPLVLPGKERLSDLAPARVTNEVPRGLTEGVPRFRLTRTFGSPKWADVRPSKKGKRALGPKIGRSSLDGREFC